MPSIETPKVALIFGASGISGWSITREALTYPSAKTFSRVLALTNRPLTKKEAFLPEDERLEIHSGFDLSKEIESKEKLGEIRGIEDVTYAYFVAYTAHGESPEELVRANSEIVENALKAVNALCPKLEFFMLQTGGKGYGTVGYGWPDAPWKESLPRIPEPFASKIFYYAQYDMVAKYAALPGCTWKFCDIRPEFLPGFVPNHNAMNITQALGLFLALYRSKNGRGAKCAFPGSVEAWTALHTDTFQDLLAHFHIYVSLLPDKEKVHSRSFNIGDGESVSWEMKWPLVCEYFGLEGVPPSSSPGESTGVEWILSQEDSWPEWVKENGLKDDILENTKWDILTTAFLNPMRIDYDLTASRELGFTETVDPAIGYLIAFDRLRKAGFLP